MKESISTALKYWVPYKLFNASGIAHCRWLYVGDENFTEPFFDETISKCLRFPANSTYYRPVSSTEVLPEWSGQVASIAPTAFIFHVSRCGSTLIAQLLGLNPANIVLSEVPFIDELLREGHAKKTSTNLLVKAAIDFYGIRRNELHKQLFIKADSWHIHFYKQLRELYPTVPFILLYRRPDEVMRSQQKQRGMQAVRGIIDPAIFNFNLDEIANLQIDEYMAKVLESYFAAFIEILATDQLALPVNYNEGAITIVKKIAAACEMVLPEEELNIMQERSGFHGKYPERHFDEPKVDTAIPGYQEKVFELYNILEKLRTDALKQVTD